MARVLSIQAVRRLIAHLPQRLLRAGVLLLAASLIPVTTLAAPPAGKSSPQPQGAGGIAVIYPDLSDPYRSVFSQIIAGIEDKTRRRVSQIAVGPSVDTSDLNNSLHRKDIRAVIALGRQGAKLAATLDVSFRVVIGGVLTNQENKTRNQQVNVLTPDPALLFARIKTLMPKVRRIFTVYDPRQNAWLIRLAKEAARSQEIELIAIEALDLRGAMTAYDKIMTDSDNSRDAIWLPQDAISAEEGTVLPMVLQESWDRNLTVFSSSPAHVRQGVLFSLYPDNFELGRHLGESALEYLDSDGNDTASLLPLRNVLISINLRTARHLGLNIGRAQNFDMVYPER